MKQFHRLNTHSKLGVRLITSAIKNNPSDHMKGLRDIQKDYLVSFCALYSTYLVVRIKI